jgi:hypothetical protein
MAQPTEARRGPEPPDLSERGGMKDGSRSDRTSGCSCSFSRSGCADASLADVLRAKISGVLYEDLNDPRGVGLLTSATI